MQQDWRPPKCPQLWPDTAKERILFISIKLSHRCLQRLHWFYFITIISPSTLGRKSPKYSAYSKTSEIHTISPIHAFFVSLKQNRKWSSSKLSFQLDLGLHRETCHMVIGELGGFIPGLGSASPRHPQPCWHHAGPGSGSIHPVCPCRVPSLFCCPSGLLRPCTARWI